jgi:drug/metabolite transporter (DMT)-like permease
MSKIIISLYALATSLALIVLKLGAKEGSPVQFIDHRLHFNINLYTVAGIGLYGTSFLLYVYLISKYDLGYIIPLTTALVYILVFVASFLIFKESFTVMKTIGIALIITGLLFLNQKKQ